MPKKPAPKMRPDVAETAFRVMQEAIGVAPKIDPANREKNPTAAAIGAKGGKKEGPARAANPTKGERREIAKLGAAARIQKGRAP